VVRLEPGRFTGCPGIAAALDLPFDAFPDTTPVMVQVNVSAPGWAPDEIERQITYPIERQLSGLAGLEEVRSISKYGISQVNLIFADEIDVYRARQQVSERLTAVALPDGVAAPELGPVSTGLGEIFHYIVFGKNRRCHRPPDGPRLDYQTATAIGSRCRRG